MHSANASTVELPGESNVRPLTPPPRLTEAVDPPATGAPGTAVAPARARVEGSRLEIDPHEEKLSSALHEGVVITGNLTLREGIKISGTVNGNVTWEEGLVLISQEA